MFFSFLTISAALLAQCSALGRLCNLNRKNDPGLQAKFFNYPFGSDIGFQENYFDSLYKEQGIYHQVEWRNDTTFSNISSDLNGVQHGEVFDYPMTTTNYSVELSGYFSVLEGGTHKFYIRGASGFSISFGRGFECIQEVESTVPNNPDRRVVATKPGESVDEVVEYELDPDTNFPMKIVIFNQGRIRPLEIRVVDPDGSTRDLVNLTKKIDFVDTSTHTETYEWYNRYTTTTTASTNHQVTVVVRVPRTTDFRRPFA